MVAEMDPNGSLTSSPKYDVYGLVRSNGGTASSKMGFVGGLGHLSEANTGLIYMKARYYDPNIGRFISQDPSGNGNNWFAYCDNNPNNRVDATGQSLQEIGAAFVLGFLAGFVGSVAQQLMENHGKVDYEAAKRTGLVVGLVSALLVAIGPAATKMLPFLGKLCEGLATAVSCKTAVEFVIAIIGASTMGLVTGLGIACLDIAAHNFNVGIVLDSMEVD